MQGRLPLGSTHPGVGGKASGNDSGCSGVAGRSRETEEPGRGDGRKDRKVGGRQSLGSQKGSGRDDTEENSHRS